MALYRPPTFLPLARMSCHWPQVSHRGFIFNNEMVLRAMVIACLFRRDSCWWSEIEKHRFTGTVGVCMLSIDAAGIKAHIVERMQEGFPIVGGGLLAYDELARLQEHKHLVPPAIPRQLAAHCVELRQNCIRQSFKILEWDVAGFFVNLFGYFLIVHVILFF